jgi:hypothetical protein
LLHSEIVLTLHDIVIAIWELIFQKLINCHIKYA